MSPSSYVVSRTLLDSSKELAKRRKSECRGVRGGGGGKGGHACHIAKKKRAGPDQSSRQKEESVRHSPGYAMASFIVFIAR